MGSLPIVCTTKSFLKELKKGCSQFSNFETTGKDDRKRHISLIKPGEMIRAFCSFFLKNLEHTQIIMRSIFL